MTHDFAEAAEADQLAAEHQARRRAGIEPRFTADVDLIFSELCRREANRRALVDYAAELDGLSTALRTAR